MQFSKPKLPREAATDLIAFPAHTVKPYRLLFAPAYCYMPVNQKFLAVKAPLDYFTPAEIQKFSSTLGNFYFPQFLNHTLRFQSAARTLISTLSWKPRVVEKAVAFERDRERFPKVPLPPAPYELSDAVLRVLGPLWNSNGTLEGFFVAAFVEELCGTLPPELLDAARDRGVRKLEQAILESSWVVYLGLLTGMLDLSVLRQWRTEAFQATMGDLPPEILEANPALAELSGLAREIEAGGDPKSVSINDFASRTDRCGQKVFGRLTRVREQILPKQSQSASIFGPGGLVDV